MTRVALLSVAFLAAASIAPRRIYTILLAQMIPCSTFIQISTANAIRIEDKTRGARADEAALGILTVVLARLRRQLALVDICDPSSAYGSMITDYLTDYCNHYCSGNEKLTDTLNAGLVGLVALITDTSVGTQGIDAQTVLAEIRYGLALINI